MITKKDLDSAIEDAVGQISHAVIKALENVATKDDLKNFATKDDLKSLVTKEDLKGVETRLDGVETRLGGVETGLGEVKEELKIVNRKIDILQKTTPNRIEFKDHEKRISRLEKASFITP